ncbi:MAG TPA: hypothetical protein VF609_11420 [Flavisolibacter sp.]
MKQWITLLAASAVFTACTKQDLQQEDLQNENTARTTVMRSTQDGAYISDWEQYNTWTKGGDEKITTFSMMRKTSEINAGVTNGGLVLGYAKVVTSDPLYMHLSKPNMLPFYYLPESERPYPNTYYFSEEALDGNIIITYRMPFTKANTATLPGGASLENIQFQHVVLSKAFLESRGLDLQTVQDNYSYDQVMALLNQ